MPSRCALVRSAGTERFISFEILEIGVLAFECAFNAFKSSRVYARRTIFFFAMVLSLLKWEGPTLAGLLQIAFQFCVRCANVNIRAICGERFALIY